MNNTNKITYEIARGYVAKGWPVFPVELSLDDKGKVLKKPLVPWRAYEERLPTDEELHRWFDSGIHNGIGMATGKLPRIIVVDADSIKDFLTSPLIVKTVSGGRHYYYRWTKEMRNDVKIEGQPLDFRGDGGFVVLPPSFYEDNAYTWEKETDQMFLKPLPDEIEKKLSIKSSISERKPILKQGDDLPSASEGERNHTAARVAGILAAGMNPKLLDSAGWLAFTEWNRTHVTPPLEERELRATWGSITRIDARNHPAITPQPEGKIIADAKVLIQTEYNRLSDTTNAEAIVQFYGDILRFDHKRKRWLIWGEHRWQPDVDGSISRFAIGAARNLYRQTEDIAALALRNKVAGWAIQSEGKGKIDAAVGIAKDLLPVADAGDNWDTNTMLLGCANGVLDLATGTLRDGKPEDRITMTTGISYDPEAKAPRWEQFIQEIFQDDEALVHYMQKALGYSLTGDMSEQALFFCYGQGSNGKGVLFSTLEKVFGDYSHDVPFHTFQRNQSTASNDLRALECKRLVISGEVLAGRKINESRLKNISGGDAINARYLYEEGTTFVPHCKLWLFVNSKPIVDDNSYGFWRRMRLIQFNRVFTKKEQDKHLDNKLRNELPGILSWLIHGCLLWQQEGLEPTPESVERATSEYQTESDSLAGFINEKCKETESAETKASILWAAYQAWAGEQGYDKDDMLGSKTFYLKLGERYKKSEDKKANFYQGICLIGGGSEISSEAKVEVQEPFHKTIATYTPRGEFTKKAPQAPPCAYEAPPTEDNTDQLIEQLAAERRRP